MKEAGRGARLRGVEVVDVVRLSLLRVLQFLYTCCGGNHQVYLTGVQWSRHKATRPAYDSSPWDDTAQSHILKERKNRIQAGVTFVTCPKGPGFMETYGNVRYTPYEAGFYCWNLKPAMLYSLGDRGTMP